MIEVSTDSTLVKTDTIEIVDNINPVVSTDNSAYMEVNPAEFTLSSGGLFAGGKLHGTIPTWLTAAIDAEIQTGGSIANIIGPMQTLIDQLEVGVAQTISSINTSNTSINSRVDSVVSEVGSNRAIDLAVVATKVTEDQSIAIALEQIGATFGGDVDAYITSLQTAYATANLAYASDVDLVTATLGSTTATVTSHDYAIVTTIPQLITAAEESIAVSLDDLQSQVDGAIDSWYYSYVPTLLNEPYLSWLAIDDANGGAAERIKHTGDLFYNLTDGTAYRFVDTLGVYSWIVVTDTAITLALANAADAQATADGKATVYLKTASDIASIVATWTAQETIDNIGDLWINIADGVTKSWDGVSTWLDITNVQTTQALLDIIALDDTITAETAARVSSLLAVETAAAAENTARVTAEANLDGLITSEESARIAAVTAVEAAYKEYSRVVTLALADGVLTPEEQDLISAAQIEVDLANARFTTIETSISTLDTTLVQATLDIANIDGALTAEETTRVAEVLAIQQAALAETAIRVAAEASLDGLITTEESARIAAITDMETAYKEYSRVVTLAISDGVLTTAEQALIASAQIEVDLAKARFTAIETAISGIDTTLIAQALATATVDGRVTTEAADRVTDILAVQQAALAETAVRVAAEASLDGLITAEETSRIAAISSVETAYKEYSRVVTLAMADGTLTPAEQTLIAAAQTEVDLANARFTTIETDSTQALGWAAGASKFITSPTGEITGWSLSDSNEEPSAFTVSAEAFVLVDPSSGNKVKMDEDGLYFQKADNTTYKYLQFINTFANHNNGVQIVLNNVKRVPNILIAPANMPVYRTDFSDQDQSFVFTVESVVDSIAATNTYSFTPKAELQLSANVFGGDILGEFTDSTTETKFSSGYQIDSAASLSSITINYDVDSEKGTGIANQYYYRNCTIRVQTSSDNVTYTDVGTAAVKTFGASLASISDSITYTGAMAASSYVRLKLVYANAGSTFTLGDSYIYNTVSHSYISTYATASDDWSYLGDCDWDKNDVTQGDAIYLAGLDGDYCGKGTQYYIGDVAKTPNAIRDIYAAGWTITSVNASIHTRTGSTLGVMGLGINTDNTESSPDKIESHTTPYYFTDTALFNDGFQLKVEYNEYAGANQVYPSTAATITQVISVKKLAAGDSTSYNTGSNFTFTANASGASVLATGTLNIIVVE